MQEKEYKDFSRTLHEKFWAQKKPAACQFELTFSCPLHCRYCYSDCYNTASGAKNQMSTRQVFQVLDKLHRFGILWLCFTGGDPLARKDFSRIYTYARKKGFIVSIFTSGLLIDAAILRLFRKQKPFCVELTLNTLNPRLQDSLSGAPGSLTKIIAAIGALKKNNVPFKIKTMVTKENFDDLKRVKALSARLGVVHQFSSVIFPRLNGDRAPCLLRLEPDKVKLIEKRRLVSFGEKLMRAGEGDACSTGNTSSDFLFRCNAGSDTFHIDPCGNMFLCTTVRAPQVNILNQRIERGLGLFKKIVHRKLKATSRCRRCSLWQFCYCCPGRAFLETGDMQSQVDYFCQVAHHLAANKKSHGKN